ncbi:MAG: transcription factor S, partial [Nitrosopumilus sp.]
MKFCPKCEVKLKKSISGLQCSKCGYTEGEKIKSVKKITNEEEPDLALLAFEGNEGEESYSTIKMVCTKCGHDEAV